MLKKLPIVGVMGSGMEKMPEIAVPLGEGLAKLRVHLLTGGGNGVMNSVSMGFAAVAERQGLTIGVIPMGEQADGTYKAMGRSYPNPHVELPIYTPLGVFKQNAPDTVNRNYINILSSDLVIALPGGSGTAQEVDLAQRFNKATLLYGPDEAFEYAPRSIPRTNSLISVLSWVEEKAAEIRALSPV